jgi:acetylornithine deacetylase/succinyl-diaminopimelate desuccinylase-like protein
MRVAPGIAVAVALVLAGPGPARAQSARDADSAQRAEAREIYRRAIAFNTSVSGGQVPQFAAYIQGLFRAAGISDTDMILVPHEHTGALLVRYRGDGSGGRPILLMAHMDVVEARREDWQRDPFTLVEENGYFYGRGTADNKSGLVTVVATLLRLRREGFTPTRDFVLVLTGDEETGMRTIQQSLRDHRDWLNAELALNADGGGGTLRESDGAPLIYTVQTSEKTYASFRLTVRNAGGHSSQPRADNAIYALADALRRVHAYQFTVMWNATTVANFAAFGAQRQDTLGAAMRRFAQRPGDRAASATLSASPFYVGQVRTTCVPTLLAGGHAENALPQSAVATINCRIFPGVAVGDVQAQVQRLAGAGVSVTVIGSPMASDASPVREDVLRAVAAAVHASYPRVPVAPSMASYATDGVQVRAAGVPTYGVSEILMKDSDDFSHGLDERVPVTAFYNGLTHWRVLLTELAGRR